MEKLNSYYLLIRWDGGAVDGFFAPQARNENHAIKQVKALLVGAYIQARDSGVEDPGRLHRIKAWLRTFKKPWRYTLKFDRKEPILEVYEWNLPFQSGYWLSMVGRENSHLCNILHNMRGPK